MDKVEKITKGAIIAYLSEFIKDELIASFVIKDNGINVKFLNGQEFRIDVKEIN